MRITAHNNKKPKRFNLMQWLGLNKIYLFLFYICDQVNINY